MFDGSLLTYFPRPRDGVAASVDEISTAISDWYEAHPGYRKNGAKIMQLMRKDGWTGWKSEGPALLANCPFYHLGYLPARTHGWDATMAEYDRKSEIYEYGYQVGHRAFSRSARANRSCARQATAACTSTWTSIPTGTASRPGHPSNDLVYLKEFFPGYRGGIVANGIHRYAPNLGSGDLALGAEIYDNLATGGHGSPALHVQQAGKPGVAVIPMVSPYVYLGGRLKLSAWGHRPTTD